MSFVKYNKYISRSIIKCYTWNDFILYAKGLDYFTLSSYLVKVIPYVNNFMIIHVSDLRLLLRPNILLDIKT